jgi:Family of unknown function (DUF6427)
LGVIGIFKERNPFIVPVLFILALALKFAFISHPLPPEPPTSGGLLDQLLYNSWWKKLKPGFLALISVSVILLSSIYFNYLLSERRMYQRTHLLTAVCFVVLTSLFAGTQRMHAGIIMLPVTIMLFRQMMMLYNNARPRSIVVNIGLIAGTGTLLYHPYWWMMPWCFWALAQMRPFKLNEWVLMLLSFVLPAYVVLSYEYLTDQWNPSAHWPGWNKVTPITTLNPWWASLGIIFLIWMISGFSQWQNANKRMLIQTRKNWYLLLMMGFFVLPGLFFPSGNFYEAIILLLLPASALGAYSFSNQSRLGPQQIFFWFLLIAAGLFSWAVLNQKM